MGDVLKDLARAKVSFQSKTLKTILADQAQERYGRTRVSRIRKRIDTLRQAIRAEGTEDIQDAWDDLEAFLPYFMKEN